MASARTLARLDALIWTLIFGGLLVLVLGIASHDEAREGAGGCHVQKASSGMVAQVGSRAFTTRGQAPIFGSS
jgi:hypothetical protein